MAQPTLYIDGRHTVNGKTSKINFDNPVAIHTFIANWIKTLPQFASGAAAITGGMKEGAIYLNIADPLVPVVAVVAV